VVRDVCLGLAVFNAAPGHAAGNLVELRLICPCLLGVASGSIVWDFEEVDRCVKLGEEGAAPDKAPGRPLDEDSSWLPSFVILTRVLDLLSACIGYVLWDVVAFIQGS